MDTIKLLIKEPNKEPYIKEVENTLKSFQDIVGGYIECVEMPGIKNVDIFCNEEGLFEQLPGNIWIAGTGDCIKGTCYMVGYDEESGESVDLTDRQIKACEKYINTFALPTGADLYQDYFLLVPEMAAKSEKYFKKSMEM